MDRDYLSETRAPRRNAGSSGVKYALAIALAAFLAGAVVSGWIAWRNGLDIPLIGAREETRLDYSPSALASPDMTPSATRTDARVEAAKTAKAVEQASVAVEKVEQVAQQTGGLDQRLAGLEQRIANLDLQAQAAAGNAARAEGLLIAFAARRRLERGDKLGYLEDQLKLRFEDAQPRAVETVIATANNPITLDQLLARLEGLTPELARSAPDEGALSWLSREVSELFVVRRESAPSPQPARRLQRARLFLESGRAAAAAAEVRNLPGAEGAQSWIADAERYAAAQRALDLLEATAVADPRELRDAAGNKVEQPSPAE